MHVCKETERRRWVLEIREKRFIGGRKSTRYTVTSWSNRRNVYKAFSRKSCSRVEGTKYAVDRGELEIAKDLFFLIFAHYRERYWTWNICDGKTLLMWQQCDSSTTSTSLRVSRFFFTNTHQTPAIWFCLLFISLSVRYNVLKNTRLCHERQPSYRRHVTQRRLTSSRLCP